MPRCLNRLIVAAAVGGTIGVTAARAELPAPLLSDAMDSARVCREAGGRPVFQGVAVSGAAATPDAQVPYATAVDLNGDGQPDFITDLAGLACENAWSIFCGSAGCPVKVWLSGAGGLTVAWGGLAQAWRLEGGNVVVSLHGQMCSPPRGGFDGCDVPLRFDGLRTSADAPHGAPGPSVRPRPRPAPAEDAARSAPGPAARPPAALQTAPGEWTHGRTADGQGMFAQVVDPSTGARLEWLCAPNRPSLLGVSPIAGPGALVFDVGGRLRQELPQVEGETAYLPIAFTAPLFAHLASGMDFGVATADGRPIGRFSIVAGTGAVGVAEGTCQAMR